MRLESCNISDSTVGRLLEVALRMILRELPADKATLYTNRIKLQAVWPLQASALSMKSKEAAQKSVFRVQMCSGLSELSRELVGRSQKLEEADLGYGTKCSAFQ